MAELPLSTFSPARTVITSPAAPVSVSVPSGDGSSPSMRWNTSNWRSTRTRDDSNEDPRLELTDPSASIISRSTPSLPAFKPCQATTTAVTSETTALTERASTSTCLARER